MFEYNNTPLEIKRNIASAEDTPADILQKLSEDGDRTVRALVASNPNTPTEVLLKLGEEFPDEITSNPIFTLLMLENPDIEFVRLSLARSSTTSEETLEKLSNCRNMSDEEVICAVAKNISTPVYIMKKLTHWYPEDDEFADEYSGGSVREAVAQNPNTPVHILDELASDRVLDVLQSVAKNHNTASFTLEKLAEINNKEIHSLILKHPNVSTTVIEIIRFL